MNYLIQILIVLIVLGGVGAFFLNRVRRLKRENSQLRSFSRGLLEAQEKERKQIAAALHDDLSQDLLIIKSRAALGLASPANQAEAEHQLKEISKTSIEVISRIRQIAHTLGPPHLEQLGLTEALDAMIDRVATGTGIRFERKLERVDDVFRFESATSLYRIVQESLNNLIKHARARLVQVSLVRDLHHVQLVIRDDGVGSEVEAVRQRQREGAFGLAEITQRAHLLGGKLQIESQPGMGMQLTLTIPLKDGHMV